MHPQKYGDPPENPRVLSRAPEPMPRAQANFHGQASQLSKPLARNSLLKSNYRSSMRTDNIYIYIVEYVVNLKTSVVPPPPPRILAPLPSKHPNKLANVSRVDWGKNARHESYRHSSFVVLFVFFVLVLSCFLVLLLASQTAVGVLYSCKELLRLLALGSCFVTRTLSRLASPLVSPLTRLDGNRCVHN